MLPWYVVANPVREPGIGRDLLDVDVRDVGRVVRRAPGDSVRLAHEDERNAGGAHPGRVDRPAPHGHRIPRGRPAEREVRVVRDHRVAARGASSGHAPLVRAAVLPAVQRLLEVWRRIDLCEPVREEAVDAEIEEAPALGLGLRVESAARLPTPRLPRCGPRAARTGAAWSCGRRARTARRPRRRASCRRSLRPRPFPDTSGASAFGSRRCRRETGRGGKGLRRQGCRERTTARTS